MELSMCEGWITSNMFLTEAIQTLKLCLYEEYMPEIRMLKFHNIIITNWNNISNISNDVSCGMIFFLQLL